MNLTSNTTKIIGGILIATGLGLGAYAIISHNKKGSKSTKALAGVSKKKRKSAKKSGKKRQCLGIY